RSAAVEAGLVAVLGSVEAGGQHARAGLADAAGRADDSGARDVGAAAVETREPHRAGERAARAADARALDAGLLLGADHADARARGAARVDAHLGGRAVGL